MSAESYTMKNLIPEQNILIVGIEYMRGNHALRLSRSYDLTRMLYKISGEVEDWVNYVVLNNFTTFTQLISFFTDHYIIKLESYNLDGFSMLITISSLNKL